MRLDCGHVRERGRQNRSAWCTNCRREHRYCNVSLIAAMWWRAFRLHDATFAFIRFRWPGRRRKSPGIVAFQLTIAGESFEYSRRMSVHSSSGIWTHWDGYSSFPDPFILVSMITFYFCVRWRGLKTRRVRAAKSIQLAINWQKLGTYPRSDVQTCNKLPLICSFTVYLTLTRFAQLCNPSSDENSPITGSSAQLHFWS